MSCAKARYSVTTDHLFIYIYKVEVPVSHFLGLAFKKKRHKWPELNNDNVKIRAAPPQQRIFIFDLNVFKMFCWGGAGVEAVGVTGLIYLIM